jgi:hypothetical protein
MITVAEPQLEPGARGDDLEEGPRADRPRVGRYLTTGARNLDDSERLAGETDGSWAAIQPAAPNIDGKRGDPHHGHLLGLPFRGHLAGSRSGTDQNVCSNSASLIEHPFECQPETGDGKVVPPRATSPVTALTPAPIPSAIGRASPDKRR